MALPRLLGPLLVLLAQTAGIPIDNGVVGYPAVTCGPHSIRVDLSTEKPFHGRIFVKGESERKDCVRGFGYEDQRQAPGYAAPAPVGIQLKFGECNMRRQRTLYPRGVEYTLTIVASFHPLFITKVDRAYRVRCFYMEAEKTVSADIDVSMLTTGQLNEQFPMPQCHYHLKRSYDGPYVRYAKVGDKVVHSWECGKVAGYVYGMLVKNCYVDDGQGNKVELIDEKGCPVDVHLIPALTYDDHLITAHVETHVFKFADKSQLQFTCSIQLCVKNDGGCGGITPPTCALVQDHGPAPGAQYIAPPAHHEGPPAPVPYGPPQSYPQYLKPAHPLDDGIPPYEEPIYPPAQAGYAGPFGPYNDDPIGNRNDTKKTKRAVSGGGRGLEADLVSPSLIVLPFEELDVDGDEQELSTRSFLSLHGAGEEGVWIAVAGGGEWRSGGFAIHQPASNLDGVCLSNSGFGILVALFVSLFLFGTTLAVLLLKRHILPKSGLPR